MTFNLKGVVAAKLAQSRLDCGFVLTTLLECLVEHELLQEEAHDSQFVCCADRANGLGDTSPLRFLRHRLDRLRSRNVELARALLSEAAIGEAAISAKEREHVADFNTLADAQGLLFDLIDECLCRMHHAQSGALS